MYLTLCRPPSEVLTPDPEYRTTATAKDGQAHIRHERRYITSARHPGRNEL